MTIKNIVCMSALSLFLTACSQEKAPSQTVDAKGDNVSAIEVPTETLIIESSEIITAIYTVEKIDYQTREVVLKDEEGNISSITASEEEQNLDQVKVGSEVLIEYLKDLSIELVDDPSLEPTVVEVIEQDRAEKGESPSVETVDTVVIIFKVEAINLENNTFKLRDPDGEITEYGAKNKDNLKKAKVGDAVVMSVTEAVSISLLEKEG